MKTRKRTVLVTGAAGFIGSHLCEELIRRNFKVIGIDNFATSARRNLRRLLPQKGRFQFYQGSVLNAGLMAKLLRRSDIVYHLASAVGVKYVIDHPIGTVVDNVYGTETVFKLANRYRKKVIFTSSSEVYGRRDRTPANERDRLVLGSPLIARGNYAAAKVFGEVLAYAYMREKKLKTIVLRIFNTIGPRQTGRYGMVFPRFVRRALEGKPIEVFGDGKQMRIFTHVEDTVKAIVELSLQEKAYGKIFNVSGNSNPISIGTLAEKIKRRLGSKSKIVYKPYQDFYGDHFEDVDYRIPDLSRLKRYIRFGQTRTLETIIDDVAAYLKRSHKRPV